MDTTGTTIALVGAWLAVMCFASPGIYQALISLGFISQTCIGNICY